MRFHYYSHQTPKPLSLSRSSDMAIWKLRYCLGHLAMPHYTTCRLPPADCSYNNRVNMYSVGTQACWHAVEV